MSSVWFADISMESLPGPRPVRPTVSLRPSMACFWQESARLVDMHALKPCARSCFSLPENLTSPRSTRMPAEPHYPLSFQKSPKCVSKNRVSKLQECRFELKKSLREVRLVYRVEARAARLGLVQRGASLETGA